MAIYYVSTARGDDSNAGTAAEPFATVSRAIGSSGPASAGDAVYVEAGIYRETVAVGVQGSSGSPVTVIGDGAGAGFRAGGYATPNIGTVEIAAWTDDATPFTTTPVVLGATNKSYIDLRGFKLVAGSGSGTYSVLSLNGGSANWTIEDCILYGCASRGFIGQLDAGAAPLAMTFRRCDFVSVVSNATYYGLDVRSPLNESEYSLDLLFENCGFYGGAGGIRFIQIGGTGEAWSTGTTIQNCGFRLCYRGVYIASPPALTTPIGLYDNEFTACNTPIATSTAGQVVEDGGSFEQCGNNSATVTTGANSRTTTRPAYSFHDERIWGGPLRPCFEPTASSPLIGAGGHGSPPTVDSWGRARPDGGAIAPSVGPTERHDVGVRDTTHQLAGSVACLKLAGVGTQDLPLLVDGSTPVTISIKVCWDGDHGDANKPQAMLLANAEVGVTAQTATATSTGGTGSTPNDYETLTFSQITPSADGVVILRLVSRGAASTGAAYFDGLNFA